MSNLAPFDGQLDETTSLQPFDGALDGEKPKPSGALRRGIADKALGFASGAVGATKAFADAAGAGNVVSSTLEAANKGINDYLSPEAKADQQEQAALFADAKAKGFNLDGVAAGAKAFAVAPFQAMSQAVGSMAPIIAGTALTGGAAPAAAVGAGIGAAIGAGTAKGAIYDEIKKRGGTEEEAIKAQEYGGVNTDQIALGGALGVADALTGASKMAGNLVRGALGKPVANVATKAAERGVIGRAGMGMLGEMPIEAAQGGQEQVAANVAAQRAGYEAGTWDNVASNATLEALSSAGPGAAFGVMNRGAVRKPESEPQPVSEVPPSDQSTGVGSGMGGTESFVPPAFTTNPQPTTLGTQTTATAGPGFDVNSVLPKVDPVRDLVQQSADAGGPVSAAALVGIDSGAHEIQLANASAADQAAYNSVDLDSADKPITHGQIAEAAMSDDDKRAVLYSNQPVADGGQRYPGTQDGDILNGSGAPFSTWQAAGRRATMEGKDWTIAKVADGFVARRKDATDGKDKTQQDAATPDWESSAIAEQQQAPATLDQFQPQGMNMEQRKANLARLKERMLAGRTRNGTTNAVQSLPATGSGIDGNQQPTSMGLGNADGNGLGTDAGGYSPHPVVQSGQQSTPERAVASSSPQFQSNPQPTTLGTQTTAKAGPGFDASYLPQGTRNVSQAAQAVTSSPQQQETGNQTPAGAATTATQPGTAGGSDVQATGVKVSQPAQPAVNAGEGAGVSQPTQAAPNQPALDRIAAGNALFGNELKARNWVQKNGLADTHDVRMTKPGRFEVVPKNGESEQTSPSNESTGDKKQVNKQVVEHSGLKISQQSVKIGDTVQSRWVVQSPENAEREAKGERQIGGDAIVDSREEAVKTAERETARYAEEKARKAEFDRQEQEAKKQAEAKKEANRNKSLLERRADAILDKPTNLPPQAGLGTGTRRESMDKAVSQGRFIEQATAFDSAAKKKDTAAVDLAKANGYILGLSNENIPVVKAALEAQARLKENKYEKPEYRVYSGSDRNGSFYEISKTEYDYAQSLKEPKAENPSEQNKFAEYNAHANQYGYEVLPDGAIGLDGKFPGTKMVIKNGRLRIESGSGDLLASYPAKPEKLGKFLESFWYAEKRGVKTQGQQASPYQQKINEARANGKTEVSLKWGDFEVRQSSTDGRPDFAVVQTSTGKVVSKGLGSVETASVIASGMARNAVSSKESKQPADSTRPSAPATTVNDATENVANGKQPSQSSQSSQSSQPSNEPTSTPEVKTYTADDVAAAEKQAAQQIEAKIDKLKGDAFLKIAKRFLPTMGVKPTLSKASNKAAFTGPKVNLLAAASELGVELPASVRAALEAKQEGKVQDAANDRVPEQSTISHTDAHAATMQAVREGTATPEQFKASFEAVVSNKDAIKAELMVKTKAELLKDVSPFSRLHKETKAEIVDALYGDMVSDYALGATVSYVLGRGGYESAVRKLVEATDTDKLAQYVKDRKAAMEEYAAQRAAKAAALENPQTLDDYRNLMRKYIGEGKTSKEAFLMLTPEQRVRFDELSAESTRESREARKRDVKTEIRAAGQTTGGEIIATKHTRDGYDLFVVKLAERVSKEDYATLLGSAKRMGGWYSAFRGNGAIPGFQFKDKANAEAFLKLAAGDTTEAKAKAAERRDAFEDDRSQSAVERLTEMADRLEERATEALNAERKVNTARRARFAASAEASANSDSALAKTMRNIAQAIADGKAKFIDAVRQKVQVEMLRGMVRTAKDAELRAKYPSYADQEKHRGEKPTDQTADFAEFPSYTAFRSDLASLARQMLEVDGTKKLGQQLMKVADDVTDAFTEFAKANSHKLMRFSTKDGKLAAFSTQDKAQTAIDRSGFKGKAIPFMVRRGEWTIITSPSEAINQGIWNGDGDKRITLTRDFGNELVQAIGRRGNKQNQLSVPWQFENANTRLKALSRMGIETSAEFRSALREFIRLQEQPAAPDKVKELERAMVGRRNDGMDFFPTPQSVADEMVQAAGIEPGMSVLEPSAGIGHIAERIRESGVEPDVVEMANDRRELLEAKGFNLVGNDFLATEGQYDRIVMNPPFSDGRDIQHVQHAYTLLKPGGRLVAIMGESAFTNQNKRATEFREWLESVGGTEEKLPDGSFMDPSLPVNTGANARMVVVEKSYAASIGDAPVSSSVQFSRTAQGQANGTVEKTVADIVKGWATRPKIVVAFDMNDERIPERVRMEDQKQRSGGASGAPEGFYYKGTVYLMSSKLATPEDVARVLFHEALGHHGLRSVFGKKLNSILNRIAMARKSEVDAKMAQYGLKGISKVDRLTAAEEILAEMAQTKPNIGFVREAIAAIRTWLRENIPGFKNLELTDDEIIRSYIVPARNFVERGGAQSFGMFAPSMARDASQRESDVSPIGFYSALARGIEASTANIAPALGWKATIKGLVNKGLAKADEVEWSGVMDFLDMQGGKVAKTQVLDFLRGNGVQVQEVVNSDDPAILKNWPGDKTLPANTKYGNYTLPGGDNYREVLLTLPEKKNAPIDSGKSAATMLFERDMMEKYGGDTFPSVYNKLSPSEVDKYEMYVREDRNAAKSESLKQDRANNYRSSHWDQPNVLAHIRLNDRTDADGKRVLFVEEVQSDWGQQGKKEGFAGTMEGAKTFYGISDADWNAMSQADRQSYVDEMTGRTAGVKGGVPTAPFVTKTDAWLNLALKRIIKMAVDEGYDKVAFVNGEQSADRYDLSKQVEHIDYVKSAPDRWNIAVVTKSGDDITRDAQTADQLEDLVGKEVAQKIVGGEGQKGVGGTTLRGLDLKVGGEGMKAFYDQIVPNAVKKMVGKLGGEVGGFSTGESTVNEIDDFLASVGRVQTNAPSAKPNLAFTITDAMREKVAGGLPLFSRAAAIKKAGDVLNEAFNHPGTVSKWHTTVGSMYNLAERSPLFKPVFDATQDFLNDVSYYGTEAANQAPKILPKLETIKDLLPGAKEPISYEDNKAISAPIFQGTLSWARDVSGKPVLVDELKARAADMTAEQKAQDMLRAGKLDPSILRMWQGMEQDHYESAVNSRYENVMLKPGVVWTDAELRSIFKLNDAQVGLYHEFRNAINTSIDNAAKAAMLRTAGKDVQAMRDMVMDAPTAEIAGLTLRDHLQGMAQDNPDRSDELIAMANEMMDQADKAETLKKEGYAPLSRFGHYTVDVVVNGERKYFSMFESKKEANRVANLMRQEYGAGNVAQATMSEREFEQFQGITPESMELFGNMLGLDSTGNEAQDKAFQTYLRKTKANRSAMKRLIHRKGVAGYSEDVGRVLAAFVYSNARQTAGALNLGKLSEAVNETQGELKDVAIGLHQYITKPQEEAQAIRGMMFAQYLGGSIASMMVNLTQPMAISFPYLSQYGAGKAAKALTKAYADMKGGDRSLEGGLQQALKIAEEQGIVAPQEVHQLMAQAQGKASLHGGDGTKLGNFMAKSGNAFTKLALGWGKLFGWAEQVNRKATFIAAYRMAAERGDANPFDFAKKAVNETQFINNRGNKMRWGRGAVGATLMTFKSYSVNYLELLHRMATRNGPEGKKAAAIMLGMLLLMAGAGGLPFADDLNDLLDFLAQRMGYNFSTKKAKQEFLEDVFGKSMADFIDRGITGLPGSPIDVSGRMSMANLLPGTGLLLEKRDHSRDAQELLGPVGDMAKRAFTGVNSILDGDIKKALLAIAPKAISNAAQGFDMSQKGYYADTKGYKVLSTTPGEAVAKAIGFQPQSVSMVQESNAITQRMKDTYALHAEKIRSEWAKGVFEHDPDQIQKARDMLKEWNDKNPDQRIIVRIPDVMKKARDMAKDKDQRIADTAPKAMRAHLKQEIMQRKAYQ